MLRLNPQVALPISKLPPWEVPTLFARCGGCSPSSCFSHLARAQLQAQSCALRQQPKGASLLVQWSGLCAFTTEGTGLIPGRGTKIAQAR